MVGAQVFAGGRAGGRAGGQAGRRQVFHGECVRERLTGGDAEKAPAGTQPAVVLGGCSGHPHLSRSRGTR